MAGVQLEGGRVKERFKPTVFSWIRGIGVMSWIGFTCTLAVVFFHFVPYLFMAFFLIPVLYRKLSDEMIGSWLIYCVALLEYLLGIKVVITGDQMLPGERSLIIMNHRTRLDWMYFWSVLLRQSGLKTEKIILKSLLKKIPGPGWAMQVGAFIFIDRKWESDKKILTKMVNYFSGLNHKTQILLFPEGTDLTPRTKARSDEFAKKNGWKTYEYCLHPRTTGFIHLTQLMREKNHLDAVYDVTVAYPYNFPQREPELLAGNIPREVHFHIERHSIESLPSSEDGLKAWCQQRWDEKEQRLCRFYTEEKAFSSTKNSAVKSQMVDAEVRMGLAVVYWNLFVTGIMLMLYYSSLARWLALAQTVLYIVIGHWYGGFEFFQADYFNWFVGSRQKKED